MFGGGRKAAQEVEQRPCEGANSSERMAFKTGLRKWLMTFIDLYVFRHFLVLVGVRASSACKCVYMFRALPLLLALALLLVSAAS